MRCDRWNPWPIASSNPSFTNAASNPSFTICCVKSSGMYLSGNDPFKIFFITYSSICTWTSSSTHHVPALNWILHFFLAHLLRQAARVCSHFVSSVLMCFWMCVKGPSSLENQPMVYSNFQDMREWLRSMTTCRSWGSFQDILMTRFCRSDVPSGSGTSCNSRCGKVHANMGQVCKARLESFSDLSVQVCDLCLEHWGWELPSRVHHHLHHNSSTQFMQSHITSSTPWFFKDKRNQVWHHHLHHDFFKTLQSSKYASTVHHDFFKTIAIKYTYTETSNFHLKPWLLFVLCFCVIVSNLARLWRKKDNCRKAVTWAWSWMGVPIVIVFFRAELSLWTLNSWQRMTLWQIMYVNYVIVVPHSSCLVTSWLLCWERWLLNFYKKSSHPQLHSFSIYWW